MENLFLFIIIAAVIGVIFIVGLPFYFRKLKREQVLTSLDMTLFLVMMPKYDLKKSEAVKEEEKALISQMEQIFTNFLYLKKPGFFQQPPRVVLEIASESGQTDISFYAAVPKYLETAFPKYVQGVYPRALVEKISDDYTIFEPGGVTVGSYLKLKESAIFPINTYKKLEKDPLAAITNALSQLSPAEGAAIQIVIRPLFNQNWKKFGEKVLSKIKEGKSVKTALIEASQSPFLTFLLDILDLLKTGPKEKVITKEPVNEMVIEAIQSKIQKQVFETNIRLIASANDQLRAEEILNHLEGVFSQFALFAMNSFEVKRVSKRRLARLIYDFSFRNFNPAEKNILNIEELTSLYHFPTHYLETPYIKSVKSTTAPPPLELLETGVNLIGQVVFRGQKKLVYFNTKEDRRRHFYLIGQTGVGKTALLREMIRQDIENGEGVGVIDPHGELIEATLANIPPERFEDVVLFEPFNLERPVGLNMLEYETPEQKDFAIQEMIAIFYKLFPPEIIGPMFEHYMRNAMLALMADKENPGTLVEIPRIFTDPEFLEERMRHVTDPIVRNFWLKEWQQTTGATRSDMLGYVVSKVGRFVENEMMRNIIGQSHSGFNLSKIMDEGKIFLANLSKGLTGEVNSSLLGLILVSKMQIAAMRRAWIPEEQRRDFYLYIDEFQNFTTDSIATILSEARKYRLNLIMAHQYIPQLKPEIRDAVFGNVGTIGSYRVGADDAEFLEKQFEPEFTRFDLVNLDNFNLIIKMLIKGKISSPFKMQTLPPRKGNPDIIQPIRKLSNLKYGRSREEIEKEIIQRSKIGV
ncbi:MAG: type IV secretory system conjugative DNA transfer family protein [Minisyncoccales bacterium]